EESADMLERLGVACFKIASTDASNIPFLRYIAKKRKPVLLSTGMCSLGETESALEALYPELKNSIVLLQCTSSYPTPIEEANLSAMITLRDAFGCPVGFSDHTEGIGASPWAVALGACVVEKHFTLNKRMAGPDHRASIEP